MREKRSRVVSYITMGSDLNQLMHSKLYKNYNIYPLKGLVTVQHDYLHYTIFIPSIFNYYIHPSLIFH